MSTLLELPESLCVADLAVMQPSWVHALLEHPQADGVVADRVQEVDGAGVQMLMALDVSLAARGQTLRLINPSVTLREAMARLGWAPSVAASEEEGV